MIGNIVVLLVSLFVSVHCVAADDLSGQVPDFTLKSNQGGSVRFNELHGQVVLLNFWASWCKPCLQEMPLLDKLHTQYRTADFMVLGVNTEDTTDRDTLRKVNAVIDNKNITFPILYDPQKVLVNAIEQHIMAKKMGLPTTVLIDRSGNARYLHEGYMPGDEHDYRRLIDALIQE
jgi:peroxiredoxin